jgi:hypothetical protein
MRLLTLRYDRPAAVSASTIQSHANDFVFFPVSVWERAASTGVGSGSEGSSVVVPSPLSTAATGMKLLLFSVSVTTVVVSRAKNFIFDFFLGFDFGAEAFLSVEAFFEEFFFAEVAFVVFEDAVVDFVVALVVAFVVALVVDLVVAFVVALVVAEGSEILQEISFTLFLFNPVSLRTIL